MPRSLASVASAASIAWLAGVASLAAVAAGGCYAPELLDCTVACAQPDDCGDGQVCGRDGFCAAPAVAGTCGQGGSNMATPDAPPTVTPDAPPTIVPDAPPPPDAPSMVTLRLNIEGRGQVNVPGSGTCGSSFQSDAECAWSVAAGTQRQIIVPPGQLDQWKSDNCLNQPATCTVTVTGPTTLVAVKLKH